MFLNKLFISKANKFYASS